MPGNHSGFPSTDRDTSDPWMTKTRNQQLRERENRVSAVRWPVNPNRQPLTERSSRNDASRISGRKLNLNLNDLIASCIEQLVEQGCTRSGCRTALDSLFERAAP
jgi:hypothetical protein